MKKTNNLLIILDLIFLIIFNALFFVIGGTEHIASAWISYGFIHFSYMMLLFTPLLIRKGKSVSVFGFSLYSITTVYFLIELITGVIFILASPDSYKAALLVQLILAGFYAVMLVSHKIANEHTANAEEERQYEIAYIKDASMKLKNIMGNISDKDAQKKVERVYDAVYSSPVKTHPNLVQIETDILQSINELEDAVYTGNKDTVILLANSLLNAVNERNMRLRTLN